MVRKNFLSNTIGSMPVMLAVALVPLLAAAGAVVDMVNANNAQTALQSAVDEAAMAGGTGNLSGPATNTLVEKYLTENGGLKVLASVTSVTSGKDATTGNFYVKVEGKVKNYFMGLVGKPTLDISGYSEVEVGSNALELALVLDNTASMNSEGRLDALKVSAKQLVSTVMTNTPVGAYVKIGIVPFSNYVNIGMGNRNKSWADVPADYTDTTQATSISYPNATYSNCHIVDHPYTNDGVPDVWHENVCDVNLGTPSTSYYYPTHTWYGCVGSRNDPMDTKIVGMGNKYPGIMDVNCAAPLTDLTDVKATLDSQIDAMVAVGDTYIPAGILWGWNMLNSNDPLSTAKTNAQMAALKGTKSLVLMTDGDNTLSPTYPRHDGNNVALANSKTAQLCENIKADGITVYTVGFKVTAPSSVAMLQACASSPTQAYNADDNAALASAFGDIATRLAAIRMAK